jgi:hypothetical protein
MYNTITLDDHTEAYILQTIRYDMQKGIHTRQFMLGGHLYSLYSLYDTEYICKKYNATISYLAVYQEIYTIFQNTDIKETIAIKINDDRLAIFYSKDG